MTLIESSLIENIIRRTTWLMFLLFDLVAASKARMDSNDFLPSFLSEINANFFAVLPALFAIFSPNMFLITHWNAPLALIQFEWSMNNLQASRQVRYHVERRQGFQFIFVVSIDDSQRSLNMSGVTPFYAIHDNMTTEEVMNSNFRQFLQKKCCSKCTCFKNKRQIAIDCQMSLIWMSREQDLTLTIRRMNEWMKREKTSLLVLKGNRCILSSLSLCV